VIGPKFREAHPTSSLNDVVAAYAADLKAHGIDAREIERRTQLILGSKPALEADYWNRFYLDPSTKVNRGPNAFLVEMMRNRQPGIALDYAMGVLFILPNWVGKSGALILPKRLFALLICVQRPWA
jgi:hypothetical protein